MNIFVMLGFALLMSRLRYGLWLGFGTCIIVVGVSMQISPLIQSLWFDRFFNITLETSPQICKNLHESLINFCNNFVTSAPSPHINFTYLKTRLTLLSCISLLTFMTAIVGRVNTFQMFSITVIFQFMWNLCYFLIVFLVVGGLDGGGGGGNQVVYFIDHYGASYVYLYAAVFGIVYTLIVNKICIKKAIKVNSDDRNSSNVSSSSKNSKISAHKNTKNHNLLTFPKSHPMNQTSTTSNLLSLLGTSILFSTFIFTSNNLIVYNPVGTKLSYFSIIWSISSSVLGTYLGSLIVGGGRVGVKETIVGVISGGVIMGSVAPIFINIGLTLFLGFLAGFINGVIYKLFYSLINKVIIYDYMGLLIPLLINSLLGSIFIPIAVFLTYSIQKASIPGLTTTPSSSSSNNNNSQNNLQKYSQLISQHLIFVAIVISFALVSAVICAFLYILDNKMKNIGVEDKNINVGGDGDGKDRVYNEYETTYNQFGTNWIIFQQDSTLFYDDEDIYNNTKKDQKRERQREKEKEKGREKQKSSNSIVLFRNKNQIANIDQLQQNESKLISNQRQIKRENSQQPQLQHQSKDQQQEQNQNKQQNIFYSLRNTTKITKLTQQDINIKRVGKTTMGFFRNGNVNIYSIQELQENQEKQKKQGMQEEQEEQKEQKEQEKQEKQEMLMQMDVEGQSLSVDSQAIQIQIKDVQKKKKQELIIEDME